MSERFANARPRKRFFLDMFTRDITLEDCILDLIDNSIDGLVRSRSVNIRASAFTRDDPSSRRSSQTLPLIKVSYSPSSFVIEDHCGGIPLDDAQKEVFNFGRGNSASKQEELRLGAYGIGLKRAIFKIGNRIRIRSQTLDDGFEIDLDVQKWAEKDLSLEDWRIPISAISGVRQRTKAGTRIEISDLRNEVSMRIKDGSFSTVLATQVSKTYAWFLDRHVQVEINDHSIAPFKIPFGKSAEVVPAIDSYQQDGVSITILATLAARSETGEWKAETAGWYVMCNARAITIADKSEVTGWGGVGGASFQPKYRGFLGMVFFESDDPLALPWTTTKRGLHHESEVFQHARNRMRGISQPILKFLDRMYSSETPEEPEERAIAEQMRAVDLSEIDRQKNTSFHVASGSKRPKKTTTRVQYDAENDDLVKIRKHIKKPSLGANKIGEHTFNYFLKAEGLD